MSHQLEIVPYSGETDQDLLIKIRYVLREIRTPTAFVFSAEDSSLPNPFLHVPPHVIGLPLSPIDAQKIIFLASRSPSAKGQSDDPSVHNSWELKPHQFSLKNPAWNKAIDKIVETVVTGLGLEFIAGKVTAKLDKLLLYETGAFSETDKNDEKAPGFFGTLIVGLPSSHKGGKLVLKHENQKHEFETANSSSLSYYFTTWYSDIMHEVLPVTHGCRLMLSYNLIRQADFNVSSFKLVQGRLQQLLALLKQYGSRLEEGDAELPPFLLHKLEHKYTQTNLKLETLEPADRAQVHTLSQVPGFHIYLATLELKVTIDEDKNDNDDDESDDDDDHYDDDDDDDDDEGSERSEFLKNIIELDGRLVAESFNYPNNALLDSTPQDENEPDKSDRNSRDGTITKTYNDTVVVLVPASKQLDFMFEFEPDRKVIGPLLCKLLQIFSKDPAQRPKLKQLCELSLKQNSTDPIPFDYHDLFDAACSTAGDEIMLDNAHMLGHWTAVKGLCTMKGLRTMKDRLTRGVHIASSVSEKIKFLKSVGEGFQSVTQKPDSIANLKRWSDETIFSSTAQITSLTKADGISLAQLCETMEWNSFESKVEPILMEAATVVRISFINQLISILQELDKKQQIFVIANILFIWEHFFFKSELKDDLDENDILHLVENTVKILKSEIVETVIIPAMLNAVHDAEEDLLFSLVSMILTNKLAGFQLPTSDAIPPKSHIRLVQALLTKFLLETIGPEPVIPENWSFPAFSSCSCSDCFNVNRFLESYVKTGNFPINGKRRNHLNKYFPKNGKHFRIKIIRQGSPFTWRIKKHLQGFRADEAKRRKRIKTAKKRLSILEGEQYSILKNDGSYSVPIPVGTKLKKYLHSFYNIIMDADFEQLPSLQWLATIPPIEETNENDAPGPSQMGSKRGADNNDGLAKRMRL